MTTQSFFLTDILNPAHPPSISEPSVQAYLKMMFTGPADGEMDIEWQESGTAYYWHLHTYEQQSPEDKTAYLIALQNDLEAWRQILGNNHMLDVVEEHLIKSNHS